MSLQYYVKKYKKLIPSFIWDGCRRIRIISQHRRVAKSCGLLINQYKENGLIFSLHKKQNVSEKIIWQYWAQGFEPRVLPEVVQRCFHSVDRYKGDFQVIRISDETIGNWVDMPSFFLEKYKNNHISATHFSDVLRLSLLYLYGGLWLDATILLTGPISEEYLKGDWFMFQRDSRQEDKRKWSQTYAYYFGWGKSFKVNYLNSFIYSKPGTEVIKATMFMLLQYWKDSDKVIDYFIYQILLTCYLERYPNQNCRIVSDCLPNLLQMYITGSYRRYSISQILSKISIHKLSYKSVGVKQLQEIDRILTNSF